MTIEEKVKKAVEYMERGLPWRDVLDELDIQEALNILDYFFTKELEESDD